MSELHLRRVDLERLAAGERVVNGEHVERCAECRAAVETIRADAAAFLRRRPAVDVVARVAAMREPWWRRVWPLVAVPVAASLVAVVLTQPRDVVRFKGGALTVLENGAPVVGPVRVVKAGAQLSFVVESSREAHALVLDLEVGKPPSAFVPFGGRASLPVSAGRTALREGVELDDTSAREWVVTLLCDHPVTLEGLQVADPVPDQAPALRVEGCAIEVLELVRAKE